MGHSLSRIILHIVFATKYRRNLIPESAIPHLHAYLATVCRDQGVEAYRVGGVGNHVHIACSFPRRIAVGDFMEHLKKHSSKWMKQYSPEFYWQSGYGVFSISYSHLGRLIRYVDNQKAHHRKRDYVAELQELCEKYDVPYDENHLLD